MLHVGAHLCEEESIYNSYGIHDDNILWIEANSDLIPIDKNNILNAVISNLDDVSMDFIITNNMQSSSILELHTHLTEHPDIKEIERRKITTITLNTLFERNNIPYDKFDFLNIDIQGAELLAFQGATKLLPHIKVIYAEVNVNELYKNCGLIDQIDAFLSLYDFKRIATELWPQGYGQGLYVKADFM